MNSFIPIGNGSQNNLISNFQPMNPYQDKVNRYMDLQQQQQTQQLSNTNMNFVVVENIQKAKEQIVPYGYTMWMRDSSEPYLYIKSVDNVGTPSFRVLKLEDVTDKIDNKEIKDKVEFVSMQSFNDLSLRVEQLSSMISQIEETKKVGRPKSEKVGD